VSIKYYLKKPGIKENSSVANKQPSAFPVVHSHLAHASAIASMGNRGLALEMEKGVNRNKRNSYM
jgi:hypothetical protein